MKKYFVFLGALSVSLQAMENSLFVMSLKHSMVLIRDALVLQQNPPYEPIETIENFLLASPSLEKGYISLTALRASWGFSHKVQTVCDSCCMIALSRINAREYFKTLAYTKRYSAQQRCD